MKTLNQNLIERRMIELDPELATHYLTRNTYGSQRNIRPLYARELAKKIKTGLFRFGQIAFASKNGSGDILINGQHVCSAVVESGMTVPCVLERYGVDSALQLSEAFRQFEILPRSITDMVKVEADALKIKWPYWVSSIVVAAAAIDVTKSKNLSTGTSLTSKNTAKKWMSKDEKVKLLGKYRERGAFINEILTVSMKAPSGSNARHLKRAAVVHVMMKTSEEDRDAAWEFWVKVRDGENLKKTMPEMKLREFLMMTRQKARPASYMSKGITRHEFAYRCALAWNSFRTGKPTNLAYHAGSDIPKLK